MLRSAFVGTVLVLFGSAALAAAAEKDDVQAAVKKMSDSGYSWKQTTEGGAGGGGQGRGGGASEGKYQADGLTWVSRTAGNNTVAFIIKGDKGAIKAGDADWVSLDDAQNDQAAQRRPRRQELQAPNRSGLDDHRRGQGAGKVRRCLLGKPQRRSRQATADIRRTRPRRRERQRHSSHDLQRQG